MDGWIQKLDQVRSVLRKLSTPQRVGLCAVALLILVCCGWWGYASFTPRHEYLLGGKTFSKVELTRTLEVFKVAGLSQHRVEGQRIAVPVEEVDRYTAAAVARQALPVQFAAEFDRMQSRVNVFTSSEQRRELLEEARKSRLAQILRAIPEIEDAVVEWDRPKSTSLFRPQTQLAAHVSIRPRDGRELSPELVQSLKHFVAGALAGATPEDVTVVDLNTSRVYGRRTASEVASDRIQSLSKHSSDEITRQITQALKYIPNVLVSVNVELIPVDEDLPTAAIDDLEVVPVHRKEIRLAQGLPTAQHESLERGNDRGERFSPGRVPYYPATRPILSKSNRPVISRIDSTSKSIRQIQPVRTARSATSTETDEDSLETEGGLHKSVQVVVSIPDEFYSGIARQRGVVPGKSLVADSEFQSVVAQIKRESQQDIREKLIRLLPLGTSPEAISITSYAQPGKPSAVETDLKPQELQTTHFGWWAMLAGSSLGGAWGLLILSRMLFRRRQKEVAATVIPTVVVPVVSEPVSFSLESVEQRLKPEIPVASPATEIVSESTGESQNPYSAILSELADRERDQVMGAPVQDKTFEFLCQLIPTDAADFLRNEPPQTIALVATGLPPARAAEVLHALPDALRWDVTQRISRMEQVAPEVSRDVAKNLEARLHERQSRFQEQMRAGTLKASIRLRPFQSPPASPPVTQGLKHIGELSSFNEPSHDSTQLETELTLKNVVDKKQPLPGADRGPVSFEDLCLLDRTSFAVVTRTVDAKSFALALFDRSDPFKQEFLSLIPRPLANSILQQSRSLGPIRLSDITGSQEAIASVIWNLALQGSVTLPPHLVRQLKPGAR